jgi:hypothetical protein
MNPFIDAWQAALIAEHQAVFGYGLLGPRLAAGDRARAAAAQAAHEAARDAVEAAMTALGIIPTQPAPDYPQLHPANTPEQARALAIRLEEDCATAWRVLYLAAAVDPAAAAKAKLPDAPQRRHEAQAGLTAAAVAAAAWRKLAGVVPASRTFPGVSS